MSLEPRDYLRHILSETDYLIRTSEGVSAEAFIIDETLQRAFVRSLEIIGEAAKKLPENLRRSHPQVAWSDMARMRDRLIHGYFGVDYELVWEVVNTKVPQLHSELQAILSD